MIACLVPNLTSVVKRKRQIFTIKLRNIEKSPNRTSLFMPFRSFVFSQTVVS